jgi:hypothetical protein
MNYFQQFKPKLFNKANNYVNYLRINKLNYKLCWIKKILCVIDKKLKLMSIHSLYLNSKKNLDLKKLILIGLLEKINNFKQGNF